MSMSTDARIEVWLDESDEWIVSMEDEQGSDTLHVADDFDDAVRVALRVGRKRDLPVLAQDNEGKRYHLGDDEYTYAVIDRETGRVLAVHYDTRDAGSPTLRALMDRMQGSAEIDAPHHVRAWVSVDGPCRVGDCVDVDEDGAATVRNDA